MVEIKKKLIDEYHKLIFFKVWELNCKSDKRLGVIYKWSFSYYLYYFLRHFHKIK
jgi:hypothetical protein